MEIGQVVEARQVAIAEPEAWALLAGAGRILVGRGAKVEEFTPSGANRPEIMAKVLGRSGSLRAPSLKIGTEFLIGYGEEMYRRFFVGEPGRSASKESR